MPALLPADAFPICERLRAAHATIRDELAGVPDDLWVGWPNQSDVYGDVRVLPLYLRHRPPTLPAIEDRVRSLCPGTWQHLADDAMTLVFSRMQPGCHVRPHRDLDGPHHLRVHLGITVDAGAWMRVNGEPCHWTDGQCLVFDPRCTHEVRHQGTTPRTILIVDFVPTQAELTAAGCDHLHPLA
ncbi:MAG: aspartyl/asparaginyl beta-hydroxylase domain-containing protein [Planctomycetota bacterium]